MSVYERLKVFSGLGARRRDSSAETPPSKEIPTTIMHSYNLIDPNIREYFNRCKITIKEVPRRTDDSGKVISRKQYNVYYPLGTKFYHMVGEGDPGSVVRLPEGYEESHIQEEIHSLLLMPNIGRTVLVRYCSHPEIYYTDDRERKI